MFVLWLIGFGFGVFCVSSRLFVYIGRCVTTGNQFVPYVKNLLAHSVQFEYRNLSHSIEAIYINFEVSRIHVGCAIYIRMWS